MALSSNITITHGDASTTTFAFIENPTKTSAVRRDATRALDNPEVLYFGNDTLKDGRISQAIYVEEIFPSVDPTTCTSEVDAVRTLLKFQYRLNSAATDLAATITRQIEILTLIVNDPALLQQILNREI